MNLFSWLLIAHMVGDYLFQNKWMAMNKANNLLPLITHCFLYTVIITLFSFLSTPLSLRGIALIFIGHIILDNRRFIYWWGSHITNVQPDSWLNILTDQSFHILLLGFSTLL